MVRSPNSNVPALARLFMTVNLGPGLVYDKELESEQAVRYFAQ